MKGPKRRRFKQGLRFSEYGDLRLFLDVCREQNMEVMLIMLPVNGWWYDYTGFPKEKQASLSNRGGKVAQEYGVKTQFLRPVLHRRFLEDVVHPAGKGWVRINEEAYKFFLSRIVKLTDKEFLMYTDFFVMMIGDICLCHICRVSTHLNLLTPNFKNCSA